MLDYRKDMQPIATEICREIGKQSGIVDIAMLTKILSVAFSDYMIAVDNMADTILDVVEKNGGKNISLNGIKKILITKLDELLDRHDANDKGTDDVG